MDRILSGVFPDSANNNYEGSQMVILIFGALNIISVFRSLIHILKEDGGAQSIATIPLDRYTKPAADTIVFLFAYWGLSQLLMALMYMVILWKYRCLLPLACLLFTIEYGWRLYIPRFTKKQCPTDATAPGAKANILFPFLGAFLFYLSLP